MACRRWGRGRAAGRGRGCIAHRVLRSARLGQVLIVIRWLMLRQVRRLMLRQVRRLMLRLRLRLVGRLMPESVDLRENLVGQVCCGGEVKLTQAKLVVPRAPATGIPLNSVG